MFSMETLIQDRQSYTAGLCEGRLNEKINELEVNIFNIFIFSMFIKIFIYYNLILQIFIENSK